MVKVLLVGLGGFLGSIARFLLSLALYQVVENPRFPFATLVINVIGCFAIGAFNAIAEAREIFSPNARLFTVVGVFGGFTTYSAFGFETMALARNWHAGAAALNVGLHLALGLGAVWLGYQAGQLLSK